MQAIINGVTEIANSLVSIINWIPQTLAIVTVANGFFPYVLAPIAVLTVTIVCIKVIVGGSV